MSEPFDPYYKWLGIPPEEQPPSYYRLLAIPAFTSDPDVIENAADQRMSHLRSFQSGPRAAAAQHLLNLVAAARICLLDPSQKAAFDQELFRKMELLKQPAVAVYMQIPVVAVTPVAEQSQEYEPLPPPLLPPPPPPPPPPKAIRRTRQGRVMSYATYLIIGLAVIACGYFIFPRLRPLYDVLQQSHSQPVETPPVATIDPPPINAPSPPVHIPAGIQPSAPNPLPNDQSRATGRLGFLLNSSCDYPLNGSPVTLSPAARFFTAENQSFFGKRLRVWISQGASAHDRISIGDSFVVSGRQISHQNGVGIGMLDDDNDGERLTVTFSSATTSGTVEDLLRSISYHTMNASESGRKLLSFEFSDSNSNILARRSISIKLLKEPSPPTPDVTVPDVAVRDMVEPKLPIPNDESLRPAIASVAEVYKSDYDEAKTAKGKLALAKKLLDQGGKNKNEPASRFAMFRIARDIAAKSGDLATAFRAIDELDATYLIDIWDMRADAIAQAMKSLNTGENSQGWASYQECLELLPPTIEEAVAADRYDVAKLALSLALQCAKMAQDSTMAKQLTVRARTVERIATEFDKLLPVREQLAINQRDAAANESVGRFLCFIKEDWERGLPMLALGNDETLRNVALEEMAPSSNAAEIADAWWKLSQSVSGGAKEVVRRHAADWYRKISPELSVTNKALIAKRIEEYPERAPSIRFKAVKASSSPPETEVALPAVELALKWLVEHQNPNGSWNFDHRTGPCAGRCGDAGNLTGCTTGASGLALLAFLGAGRTHKQGEHQESVEKGLKYLISRMKTSNGVAGDLSEGGGSMYSHGIAARALGEAYALTNDRALRDPAQTAVNFIVAAQDPQGGGWRYQPRQPGDTSVFGWQMSALVVARDASLIVPTQTFTRASLFLDSVQTEEGSQYGYTGPGAGPATSAIGLFSRMCLGWQRAHPSLQRGVQAFAKDGPSDGNMYFNYYATQVLRRSEGAEWDVWSKKMQDHLELKQQSAGHETGSWFMTGGDHGSERGGRTYVTALAAMTLQACYRDKAVPGTDLSK